MTSMRLGVKYLFRNPSDSGVSNSYVYAAQMEQIRLAEELGFDDIWTAEHHQVDDGWMPSPLTVAAAIATATSRVEIATNALLLPLHHPLRLAEDAAVVDNLSGGRFLLGVALGWREREFDALGVPYRERASRFEEAVEILRRCWSEDRFSFSGRHWQLDDVRCTPKPTRPIPIWLGGGIEKAVRRAARLGDGWLAASYGEMLPVYLDELEQAGRPAETPQVAGYSTCWIFPTRDPERDWAMIRPLAIRQVELVHQWNAEAGRGRLHTTNLDDESLRALFEVDTPENVARTIEAAYENSRLLRHIHIPVIEGVPLDRCAEALKLFAAEVLPAVRSLGQAVSASATADNEKRSA
jgi:probable F420-dependent oxidoreductase